MNSKLVHIIIALNSSTDRAIRCINCKLLWQHWRRLNSIYWVTILGAQSEHPINFSYFYVFCWVFISIELEKGELGHNGLKRCAVLWREKFKFQVETQASSLCIQQNEKQSTALPAFFQGSLREAKILEEKIINGIKK